NSLDFLLINTYIKHHFPIPNSGVTYVASIDELNELPIAEEISNQFYGAMPVQIGYCAGTNNKLNALEYHKGSELTVDLTDILIIVGSIFDITDGKYDTELAEIFYVPKDTAYELYASTLHYAPCNAEQLGFQTVVILPYGTNFLLEKGISHDKYLLMKNKWLMCHSDRKSVV